MENIIDIKDKTLGVLSGRDCIYLDTLTQDEFGNLTFKGEINGTLAEKMPGLAWIPYTLKFRGVAAYHVYGLDAYFGIASSACESSFCMVENSEWLSSLIIKTGENEAEYRHYRLYTYDFAYNIIAKDHEMELNIV